MGVRRCSQGLERSIVGLLQDFVHKYAYSCRWAVGVLFEIYTGSCLKGGVVPVRGFLETCSKLVVGPGV